MVEHVVELRRGHRGGSERVWVGFRLNQAHSKDHEVTTVTIGPSLLHKVTEIDENISDTVMAWERGGLGEADMTGGSCGFSPSTDWCGACPLARQSLPWSHVHLYHPKLSGMILAIAKLYPWWACSRTAWRIGIPEH